MTNALNPDVYVGRNAVDPQGNKIGTVGQVYLNDQTGQPDWITVNTGLFGMKENFAPLAGSSFNGDDLVLPFDKTIVKDSPDIADSSHLDIGRTAVPVRLLPAVPRHRCRRNRKRRPDERQRWRRRVRAQGNGYDVSGPNTDDAMTRSEEQLRSAPNGSRPAGPGCGNTLSPSSKRFRYRSPTKRSGWNAKPITDANRATQLSGAHHHRRGTRSRADRRAPGGHHRGGAGGTRPTGYRNRHRHRNPSPVRSARNRSNSTTPPPPGTADPTRQANDLSRRRDG